MKRQQWVNGSVMVAAVGAVALAITVPLGVIAAKDEPADAFIARDAQPPGPRTAGSSGDEPQVTCGGGSWPVSAMDGGLSDSRITDVEVQAAFADVLERAPIDAPQPIQDEGPEGAEWILLTADTGTGTDIVLGVGEWSAQDGPGQDAMSVSTDQTPNGLRVNGWGDCQLSVALPEGRAQVEVTGVRLDPATGGTTIVVNERDCTSGRNPKPFLGEPAIVEDNEKVTVFLSSEAGGERAYNCVGNPSVEVPIDLTEPLGDRTLYDAGVWPFKPAPVLAAKGPSNVQ